MNCLKIVGFSKEIIEKITDCLHKNQQSLLFINRRGYSPTLLCKKCYEAIKCNSCDCNLYEHKFFEGITMSFVWD